MKHFIPLFAILLIAAALPACGESTSSSASSTTTISTNSAPATANYPPKTKSDLHGLAAKGDASAIHGFHSESVGLVGVCPQPRREVVVDPSITGEPLAEDLLAYFYAQQMDSPCGSLLLAYHEQGEVESVGAYTAGRINFDATDSSGQENTDPNAGNLKHQLTLDIGGLGANQEYIVTY